MKHSIRRDLLLAGALTQGYGASSQHCHSHAWTYVRRHGSSPKLKQLISAKIASRQGIPPLPLQHPARTPRRNVEMALIVDKAIQLATERGRHYAEAFLRLYSVDTALVMRVLFDRDRRRAPT